MFFADVVKCFDKLWLKGCLLEMCNLSYGPNILKILHEMNRETDIIIITPVENRKYTGERSGRYLDPSCAVQKHPQLTTLEKK